MTIPNPSVPYNFRRQRGIKEICELYLPSQRVSHKKSLGMIESPRFFTWTNSEGIPKRETQSGVPHWLPALRAQIHLQTLIC